MHTPSPEPPAPTPTLLSQGSRLGGGWGAREWAQRTIAAGEAARRLLLRGWSRLRASPRAPESVERAILAIEAARHQLRWRWWRLAASLGGRQTVERIRSAVDRARGQMLASLRNGQPRSRPSRRAHTDELLLAPPDLRVPDPSFLDELRFGSFGLAGEIADLGGRSPFARARVSADWARELHGFGWLRHLDADRSESSELLARRLVHDWLQRGCRDKRHAWAPEVTGRRLMSWLSHSALLLDGAEPKFYAAVMRSLQRQTNYLATAWQQAAEGHDKLIALIGLVLADVCMAGRDRQLKRSQKLLAAEIERQILADGGHIGRNPQTLVELLLDVLPLRQCFLVRGLTPLSAVPAALGRMVPMLRHLRLGDGSLARFNGVGATDRDALATVLAYDKGEAALPALAPQSGYARLARGSSIVVVDVGPAPPLGVAHNAHAGCLSVEVSVGDEPLFVNNGRPGLGDANLAAAARATASHNTLCLKEQSSSILTRRGQRRGALPIEQPDRVSAKLVETQAGLLLEASHDGYLGRWGIIHARSLSLDAAGDKLQGSDRLLPAKGVLRFSWDVPFAIHFHVHPNVEVWPGRDPDTADLVLKSGQHWRLKVTRAALAIEPSVYSGGALGPRPGQQLVLRATCHGEAKVDWEVARMPPGHQPEHATQVATALAQSLGERLALAGRQFEAAPEYPSRS